MDSGDGIPGSVALIPIHRIPMVRRGDDIAALVYQAATAQVSGLTEGDILVIAQKIVSKAEGREVALDQVVPSRRAHELGAECGKDPRFVELVLREASEIVRVGPDTLIARHRLGPVMANAGIDRSNLESGESHALLLPANPDESCARLRDRLKSLSDIDIAVVMNDSWGRPWRLGAVGFAVGAAGLQTVVDRRGEKDLFGRTLQATICAPADEIAAAASLLMGQGAEGVPAVIIRGLGFKPSAGAASDLVRPREMDLFR